MRDPIQDLKDLSDIDPCRLSIGDLIRYLVAVCVTLVNLVVRYPRSLAMRELAESTIFRFVILAGPYPWVENEPP